MAQHHHTPETTSLKDPSLEDALTALFCLVDDVYRHINPRGLATAAPSNGSRAPRYLSLPSCSNFGAWSPAALFCATPGAFSATSSRA
jgi:hypothetical protein